MLSDPPPLNNRTGRNFSRYGIKIYDPDTAHLCKPGTDTPTGVACGGTFIRTPFPNNVNPQSRITEIGQRIFAVYPALHQRTLTHNYVTHAKTGAYICAM